MLQSLPTTRASVSRLTGSAEAKMTASMNRAVCSPGDVSERFMIKLIAGIRDRI
ncbi:hypothetical protein [Pseudaminobacter soli (ex Li et al. 2025)]|uniref:hypothetical protein n=1 Tax=Pseudaminobacter soli (ex Li et al. 2025) TaxID=1295366 RepID=UPI001FE0E9DB|nr:hypothetical protein [Mesorhizobium soli]